MSQKTGRPKKNPTGLPNTLYVANTDGPEGFEPIVESRVVDLVEAEPDIVNAQLPVAIYQFVGYGYIKQFLKLIQEK